jgi:hypothetical protein
MISGITVDTRHFNPPMVPYNNFRRSYAANYNDDSVGSLRIKENTGAIEVCDGQCWFPIQSNNIHLSLTHDVAAIIDWARKKWKKKRT